MSSYFQAQTQFPGRFAAPGDDVDSLESCRPFEVFLDVEAWTPLSQQLPRKEARLAS